MISFIIGLVVGYILRAIVLNKQITRFERAIKTWSNIQSKQHE